MYLIHHQHIFFSFQKMSYYFKYGYVLYLYTPMICCAIEIYNSVRIFHN